MEKYQSAKPCVDMIGTVALFDTLTTKRMGAEGGSVQMRETGILVHPGEIEPTEVVFDIAGRNGFATLAAWIAPLPDEALANAECGVAALQLFLDETPLPRREVTRHDNLLFTFDTSGVRTLKVVADSANGMALYDWLFIGVM